MREMVQYVFALGSNKSKYVEDPVTVQKASLNEVNAVLWHRNYLLRFRFWLLKSYGSGSGSGPNFWKVLVPVPVPTFEKVTVPVPVPAPYLDHKKQIYKKKFW